jgi:hypothetical protein
MRVTRRRVAAWRTGVTRLDLSTWYRMSTTTDDPQRYEDVLDARLWEYYAQRRRPIVDAALRTLLAIRAYLDPRDFGRLLDGATEALVEPDRYRLGSEWFQTRLEQGMHARMDGSYTTVTRMAVRSLATIESALGDDFRVFLHLAAESHRSRRPQTAGPG